MDAKAMTQIALAHTIAQIGSFHVHEVVEGAVKQIPHAWLPSIEDAWMNAPTMLTVTPSGADYCCLWAMREAFTAAKRSRASASSFLASLLRARSDAKPVFGRISASRSSTTVFDMLKLTFGMS